MSLYDDGTFVVLENTPYSEDEKVKLSSAFKIKDQKVLKQLRDFIKEQGASFVNAPFDLNCGSKDAGEYTLSINGLLLSGSFLNLEGSASMPVSSCPKDDEKKAKWNNKVVNFVSELSNILFSQKKVKGEALTDPKEAYYCRPVCRYLMSLCLNHSNGYFETPTSEEDACKLGAKEALKDQKDISGEVYNKIIQLLKEKALANLKASHNLGEFDKLHSDLVLELVQLTGLPYASMAYLLDLTYIYELLTMELIIDERSVAFLHSPIKPQDLKDINKSDDATSYHLYVSEGRSEWAPLHISPAYFYLESIYSLANPDTSKKPTGLA
jgi:hypothetical protein